MAATQDVDEGRARPECREFGVQCIACDKVIRLAEVHKRRVRRTASSSRLGIERARDGKDSILRAAAMPEPELRVTDHVVRFRPLHETPVQDAVEQFAR